MKNTRVYQEAFNEGEEIGKEIGKLEIIPNLIQEGFSAEKIAQLLNLPLDEVGKIVQQNQQGRFNS